MLSLGELDIKLSCICETSDMYGFVDRNLEVDCNEEAELLFEIKTT